MGFDTDSLKDDICEGIKDDIKDIIDSNVEHFVEKYLDAHLDDQPYSIECEYCHKDLDVTRKQVDCSFDLILRVEPCDCQKEE